jgi:hypothetical protein
MSDTIFSFLLFAKGFLSVVCISLKRMKNKISEYGLYITKMVYYEVSCGVVVGWVLKSTVDRVSDPAGAATHTSHSDAAFNFCPDARVHRLTRR